jgi:integrase/recombinase XerC
MYHIQSFLNYLEFEKNYAKNTLTSYALDLHQFKDFIIEEYGVNNVSEINYAIIRQWVISFVDKDLTHKTINRKLSSLKTFFKFLVKTKLIEENPMHQHKSLKLPKQLHGTLSRQEMEKLSDYYKDQTFDDLRSQLMIELLYSTGMRRQELIDLSLQNVDFNLNQLKILGKRNKERIVPLMNKSLELLKKYAEKRKELNPQTDKLFITKKGKAIYPNLVYRTVSGFLKRVSTQKKVSPHVLRHAFATHLLENGAEITAIKDLLGHSSLASTEVYTHSNLKELRKAHAFAHPRSKKENR